MFGRRVQATYCSDVSGPETDERGSFSACRCVARSALMNEEGDPGLKLYCSSGVVSRRSVSGKCGGMLLQMNMGMVLDVGMLLCL